MIRDIPRDEIVIAEESTDTRYTGVNSPILYRRLEMFQSAGSLIRRHPLLHSDFPGTTLLLGRATCRVTTTNSGSIGGSLYLFLDDWAAIISDVPLAAGFVWNVLPQGFEPREGFTQ